MLTRRSLLATVAAAIIREASSTKHHVEVTGSDLLGDGTRASPFRTAERALAAALRSASSEISFGPGIHLLPEGGFRINNSGVNVTGAGVNKTFLSGATPLSSWTKASSGDKLWTTKTSNHGRLLMQLFVQDKTASSFARRSPGDLRAVHIYRNDFFLLLRALENPTTSTVSYYGLQPLLQN